MPLWNQYDCSRTQPGTMREKRQKLHVYPMATGMFVFLWVSSWLLRDSRLSVWNHYVCISNYPVFCYYVTAPNASEFLFFHPVRRELRKKNASHGNEVLPQDTTHLIQRPCYQRGSPCKDPAGNSTTKRPPDIVKRRELKWYGHVSRSLGLARTNVQGTVKGGRRQGRQRER